MDVPGPYDVHAWQADHVGNDSQRMAAMKLLDARREYEVALARLIARVECALQENKDKQVTATILEVC
ncbi:hypothetical protein Tcan_02341 [Toxocara canis]|uniref:Uncharacterized protein n=1 Tax=Toxocara canis TaxID=6265 RepID=A0A0B2UQ47_TOXCA|nr:hypothetical protein Tcan_02341 [Toxocara canis]